ncbi:MULTISPECIES: hypothetical protein [unclassified Shewanella]|uniref:hypothetical protein n=1 Tax=unclassified Shewanella TaxID=196818 RepID=UPI0021DB4A8F|nr:MULTISPECIES: hypothetical protein [unclassified Shewanella]MCU8035031.1 hypothetical protein [Shewanella sp. SM71]MCU8096901.1 hypothetical protein [Shewanella sp. SM102]
MQSELKTLKQDINVEELTISIPSVRDTDEAFYVLWRRLFGRELLKDRFYNIFIVFDKCNYAGVNLTALIGAYIQYLVENYDCKIKVETNSMNDQVHLKLRNMELLHSLDKFGFRSVSNDIIPYRKFDSIVHSERDVLRYLEADWLSRNRLNLSLEVKASVLSSMWEIFANAFEHSHSRTVHCCGSYDNKEKTLSLLVGDTGQGIVVSICQFLRQTLEAKVALSWALVRGNSTYTANLKDSGTTQPRGLGLHLLTQFVDINEGVMEIYTDNVFYRRENKLDIYEPAPINVHGSWVRITLRCKRDVLYCFKDEQVPDYF